MDSSASRSRPAENGVAEWPVEVIEDRRSCEEALSLARQGEHLRTHVVDDETIVAVESDRRQGGSALFLQRQRRQIQTDGPSLGGVCELHGLGSRRSDTGSPQQSLRLGRAEHEVVDADLDQSPVGAEPRESDVRDGSRRERHQRALRDVPGDRRDRIHDHGLAQTVEVVQDEHERLGPRGERGTEARGSVPAWLRWKTRSPRTPAARSPRPDRARPQRVRGRRRDRRPPGDPRERRSDRSAHSASSVVLPYPAGAVIATTEAEREARRRSTKPVRRTIPGRRGRESFASVISNDGAVATRLGELFRATRRIVRVPMVVTQSVNYSERPFLARGTDDERSPTALPGHLGTEQREPPTGDRVVQSIRIGRRRRLATMPGCRGGSGCRLPKDEDAGTTELSNEDLQTVLGLIKDADSVELKLTIHESARADAARGAGRRPARLADPSGVLLRYARAGAERRRRGRPGPTPAERTGRHGREAPAGRAQ